MGAEGSLSPSARTNGDGGAPTVMTENEEAHQENSVLSFDGQYTNIGSKPDPSPVGGRAAFNEATATDTDADVEEVVEDREESEDVEGPEETDEDDSGEDDEEEDTNPKQSRDRPREMLVNPQEDGSEDEEDGEEEEDEGASSDAASEESDASSNVENEWEGDSEVEGEGDTDNVDPNQCIFCNESEDNDPSEEFEEYLACAACGDNAHRQCARDADTLASDDDAELWRCPNCVENEVEPKVKEPPSPTAQRRSSAPKIARDLLPAQRGTEKPGSHTIFGNLILHDDPMDGSRSLRKRKSSEAADEKSLAEFRKRPRRSTEESSDSKPANLSASQANSDFIHNPSGPINIASPRLRPSRARNLRAIIERPPVTVLETSEDTLILSFNLEPAKLASLAKDRKRRRRRERDRARRAREAEPQEQMVVSHYPALQPSSFAMPFFSLHDRDGDGTKSKPYGGILSESAADTTKTFPQAIDRRKFEDARLKAEDLWRKKAETANALEIARPSQKVSGPPSKIKCIHFGQHEIDTWHAAPYPEEYSRNKVLYICEFCLKYMNSDFVAWRHKLKCPAKHPPGDEIYRDGQFSFFEVDGRKNPVYCQNLCLLAKLFLGSKTLYYDVEPFLFYVMTENDKYGDHFVGYFSKEKRPSSLNNVSCILVLPIHQRRGFGHYLIEFSYLLTRVEQRTGSPEKPLSDMGLVSYRSYWRLIMCQQLLNRKSPLSINDISDETGMTADDIVSALEGLRALVRDPVTKTYALRLDHQYYRQYVENYERKGYYKVNPDALVWVPYVMGRDNMHYENAAPLHTVAQREEIPSGVRPEEGVQQLAANGVSEKDYAADRTESQPSVSGVATPQEEEADKNSGDSRTTPFPSLEPETFSHDESTAKKSPPAVAKILPTTPFAKPAQDGGSPIPATRFEIFPPLPGTSARKRPGRPPLSRPPNRRSTPSRNLVTLATETADLATSQLSVRRTRSKLAEMVTNGTSEENSNLDPSIKSNNAGVEEEDREIEHHASGDVEETADEDTVMRDT